MNDEKERNESSNFRSITCFPIMRKVSAEVMTEQVYGHMEREKLWPDEQKGYIRQKGSQKSAYKRLNGNEKGREEWQIPMLFG